MTQNPSPAQKAPDARRDERRVLVHASDGATQQAGVFQRETISAVLMTRNCEDLIEGTLKSVKGWVDEIVVIDGCSTDRTVEICERYGARVIQNRWDGFRFSTERNLGIQHATKDWCFHVDPDERATPEFRDAVLKMLSKNPPVKYNAFEFRKRNFFMGHAMRYGGWYHYSLHLFRRDKARYEGIIHEKLIVDGGKSAIGKLEAPIDHHPYPSIRPFVSRHNGYSSREAAMLDEERPGLTEKDIDYNLRKMPLKRFFKFYVKKAGFLDGSTGLIFSVLYAWVHFLNWAKYWELKYAPYAKNTDR
jgi:glycosyltransferase involved in cell wall biosynthesis